MKTALKITITPEKSRIIVEVDSCIFALQAIPSVISILLFWPLVITQTWGLLQQSKLNEYVMDLIKKSLQQIVESSKGTATNGSPCFG